MTKSFGNGRLNMTEMRMKQRIVKHLFSVALFRKLNFKSLICNLVKHFVF